MIFALLSSAGAHNILYRMFLAGILPSKWSNKKCVVSSGNSSPIKQTHENPLEPIKIFCCDPAKKICYIFWKCNISEGSLSKTKWSEVHIAKLRVKHAFITFTLWNSPFLICSKGLYIVVHIWNVRIFSRLQIHRVCCVMIYIQRLHG